MRKILIILGLLVAVMPFLGFPRGWKDAFFFFVGVFLFVVAFGYRTQRTSGSSGRKTERVFIENEPESASLDSDAEEGQATPVVEHPKGK